MRLPRLRIIALTISTWGNYTTPNPCLNCTNHARDAAISGDHNPLHVDSEFAAAGPFGVIVAHGPIALQTVFEAVAAWLGTDGLPQGVTIDVAFRGPVRAGATVVCRAGDIVEHAGRVVVLVHCTAGDDEILQAVVNLPRELAPAPAS